VDFSNLPTRFDNSCTLVEESSKVCAKAVKTLRAGLAWRQFRGFESRFGKHSLHTCKSYISGLGYPFDLANFLSEVADNLSHMAHHL
jgi:hypothetical protein